jgi:hypothetical protein
VGESGLPVLGGDIDDGHCECGGRCGGVVLEGAVG